MSSLGFSEYTESNNSNGSGNSKINNRRNGGSGAGSGGSGNGIRNRTLKIPRNQESSERGLLQSSNGSISGINNENGTNGGMVQQAGQKIKQIKDYIENIHRKGGEDSDVEDDDPSSVLPSYPAQGMGVYATNVTQSSNTGIGGGVVRKTTQMNSLNPTTSYSSTLLEGMEPAIAASVTSSPYFEKLTGIPGAQKRQPGSSTNPDTFSTNAKSSTYASQYYEQFVPYAESLASQLSANGGNGMSGTNTALIEKLNYIIHMLEEKKDEKTGHVIEELVLYCFLGVFIIFVVDTFTRAASGGGGGGRGGAFGMFGGRSKTLSAYHR